MLWISLSAPTLMTLSWACALGTSAASTTAAMATMRFMSPPLFEDFESQASCHAFPRRFSATAHPLGAVCELRAQKGAQHAGQCAGGRSELLEDREVVVAGKRSQLRGLERLRVVHRLPLQLRQLSGAVREDQRLAARRLMQRAVAARLGLVEAELLVQIAKPDWLEIVDAADGKPAAHA